MASSTGIVSHTSLYKAWGETRYTSGASPTTYRYTGQREEASFGLYYYNARWYDPALGRFAQADTIVPDGVQGLDRYAYVNNNPVIYNDPSGHSPCEDWGACKEENEEIEVDEENGLSGINNTDTTNDPPHPDAPPDFDHPLPTGNPQPPHVDGLPDDQWEWNDDWLDLGPGYRNKQDPSGTVWRPDNKRTNRPGTEGEMPHWHGRAPGNLGKDLNFPGNYQWGRGGQRKYPGDYNHDTQQYDSVLTNPNDVVVVGAVPVGVYVMYRVVRILISPACGFGQPVCAFGFP